MCSYIEIQNPPKRYGVIDIPCMQALFGYSNFEHFTGQYRHWVQVTIDNGKIEKEGYWTESVAVGALRFV